MFAHNERRVGQPGRRRTGHRVVRRFDGVEAAVRGHGDRVDRSARDVEALAFEGSGEDFDIVFVGARAEEGQVGVAVGRGHGHAEVGAIDAADGARPFGAGEERVVEAAVVGGEWRLDPTADFTGHGRTVVGLIGVVDRDLHADEAGVGQAGDPAEVRDADGFKALREIRGGDDIGRQRQRGPRRVGCQVGRGLQLVSDVGRTAESA